MTASCCDFLSKEKMSTQHTGRNKVQYNSIKLCKINTNRSIEVNKKWKWHWCERYQVNRNIAWPACRSVGRLASFVWLCIALHCIVEMKTEIALKLDSISKSSRAANKSLASTERRTFKSRIFNSFAWKLFGNLSLHRLLNVALHLKFPVNFEVSRNKARTILCIE